MVQPQVAVFGKKDFQQLFIIRALVQQLNLPIDIVAGATVREADGLAMSSRNQFLDAAAREKAPELHRVLQAMRNRILDGEPHDIVEQEAHDRLAAAGFDVDYTVVRAPDLGEPRRSGPWVALAAAKLGATRLIDNVEFRRDW